MRNLPIAYGNSCQLPSGRRIPAFHAQDKEQRKGGGIAATGSEAPAGAKGMAGQPQAGSRG